MHPSRPCHCHLLHVSPQLSPPLFDLVLPPGQPALRSQTHAVQDPAASSQLVAKPPVFSLRQANVVEPRGGERGKVREEPGVSWESRWLLSHNWMWPVSVPGLPTSHWTPLPLPCPWRLVEHVLLPCCALVKPHLSLPFASRKGQCFLQ